jgi:putative heme iron utilization protein
VTGSAIAKEARALLHAQRWAALATVDGGEPLASMVAYAIDEEHRGLLLLLSQLAQHTKNLLNDPRASLVVSEPDAGDGDPQRLQRLTVQASVAIVRRDASDYVTAAERYIERFPDALPRFELGDFVLFRLVAVDARYVGGFARAARFTWADLA